MCLGDKWLSTSTDLWCCSLDTFPTWWSVCLVTLVIILGVLGPHQSSSCSRHPPSSFLQFLAAVVFSLLLAKMCRGTHAKDVKRHGNIYSLFRESIFNVFTVLWQNSFLMSSTSTDNFFAHWKTLTFECHRLDSTSIIFCLDQFFPIVLSGSEFSTSWQMLFYPSTLTVLDWLLQRRYLVFAHKVGLMLPQVPPRRPLRFVPDEPTVKLCATRFVSLIYFTLFAR